MKKLVAVGVIFILAILASIECVEAWNGWTPATIHEVQFDGTNYYAPVDEHDMYNNSPLLISDYLIWENFSTYLPIVEKQQSDNIIPITEDQFGKIYIDLQKSSKIVKNTDAVIGIPILAYNDSQLGENILNLPVLGNTNQGGLENLYDPYSDYYVMIPLKSYPQDHNSYVAYLIEDPIKSSGNDYKPSWVIPLVSVPSDSLSDISNVTGGWDIQMDVGLILDYVPVS